MCNKILGIINRSFKDKSAIIILRLYKSLVRPHLDYCSQAWNLYLIKDIVYCLLFIEHLPITAQ